MVSTLLVNKISHDSTMQPILRREVALGELAYICQAGWSSLPLLQPDLQCLKCGRFRGPAVMLSAPCRIFPKVSFGGVTFYYAS
ncbi:uncharacterized protein LOC135211558 isoform X2 [Macrobrachium nipponense]|uniref:uncharacterized protein LOC135211558 isoform X2 n=1 Tax=Macrobrachium nipponense TaxID=159736 RepID=UPI0030C7CF7B